jgi:hypothetical protein
MGGTCSTQDKSRVTDAARVMQDSIYENSTLNKLFHKARVKFRDVNEIVVNVVSLQRFLPYFKFFIISFFLQ